MGQLFSTNVPSIGGGQPPSTDVARQMGSLRQQVERLTSAAAALQNRLDPLLQAMRPVVADNVAIHEEPLCPHTGDISEVTRSVANLASALEDTVSRLSI